MGEGWPGRWVWWVLAFLCLACLRYGPDQIVNMVTPRVPAQKAVYQALGSDVRLEGSVRIRPRWLGEPGRRMAFKRVVVCGWAVSPTGTTPVAVVYPLRRSSRRPSVVTPANPAGSGGDGTFIGHAVLTKCAQALRRAS